MVRPSICFVVSAPDTARSFLSAHIRVLSVHYDVTLIANFPAGQQQSADTARHVSVPIERRLRPFKDLTAWLSLYRVLRRGRFQSVHSVTPKAGLLAMTAGWAARVPNRFHWFTGQVWVTRAGVSRTILKAVDRIIEALSTKILVDSKTQRDFLVRQGLTSARKSVVLGSGSICGVDTARFSPNPETRMRVRGYFGIGEEEVVILFIGRLTRDKGILELCAAFTSLRSNPSTRLMLVGPDEEELGQSIMTITDERKGHISIIGLTDRPEDFMAASDLLCLPSYREGFGLSVIEAASCAVPCVASDIYGLRDAVCDGFTGLLFPVGEVRNLAGKLQLLIDDAEVRNQMGIAGRRRAAKYFDQSVLTANLEEFYATQLGSH